MPSLRLLLVCFGATICWLQDPALAQQGGRTREELTGDAYYVKWLNQDVLYIITPDERAVFGKLQTLEEKEQFIEQFWRRRDPDPMTPDNEFREEHYRRVQYANEQFYSGKAGWMTDRGRIYIRFGPPDSRHRFSAGETYVRKQSEGGGITKTHPFEVWRYAFIEGIGPDVEIEFVDPTNTGEFRMTIDPQEKDALLRAGSGPTEYEEAGLESRYLRLQRSGLATNYIGPTKDLPFERLARLAVLDKAPPLKFDRLREIVNTFVTYDQLPSNFRYRYIRLTDASALALVNIEIPNSALSFAKQGEALRAEVEIYGRIVDLSDRILSQFEDTLGVDFAGPDTSGIQQGTSSIQKNFLLPPGTFRLDIALKDTRSNQVGTRQERIVIPPLATPKLWATPVILAHSIEAAGDSEGVNDPYLLGPLRVRPQPALAYSQSDSLLAYLQVYNSKLDPSAQAPALTVRYNIMKDGRLVFGQTDDKAKTIQFVSEQRVVLLASVPLARFEPGRYRLLVQVTDRVSSEAATADANFTITPPNQLTNDE